MGFPRRVCIHAWRFRRPSLRSIVFSVVLGTLLFTGMVATPSAANTTWTVGIEPTYPPFGFRDTDSDSLTGFDVELMEAVSQQAGHRIDWMPMPFDGLIPALQANSLDMAISAVTITEQRSKAVTFSKPYFQSNQAIASRVSSPPMKGIEDLTGRSIAVQIGTTGAINAAKIKNAEVITFDSNPLALQELSNGNVDAVLSDRPAILYAIDQAGMQGIRLTDLADSQEFFGILLPKNSPLEESINSSLTKVIQQGTYADIYRRWFGADPPPLPDHPIASTETENDSLNLVWVMGNLLKGAWITLVLTLLSFTFGILGGSALAVLLQTPWRIARLCCQVYIDFFRGTPMLVQLFLIYFGLPALLQTMGMNWTIPRLPAAVAAFSMNGAAYLAEILRSGIESIDRGQWEAADSLGFSPVARMQYLIAPQALRRVLPPLSNEFITLIKDTSLAAVIGFDELFRQGQLMVATTYRAFAIYCAVALVYLIFTTSASLLFKRLERRLSLPG